MNPGDFIKVREEAKPERVVSINIFFHATDAEVQKRVEEIAYVVESGLGTDDDPKVREYTYVEAIVTKTETRP